MHYIYALVDPRDSQTRYIGCTSNPKRRLSAHKRSSRTGDRSNGRKVKAWILELVEQGHRPVMIVLQQVDSKHEALGAETYWIRHFKRLGAAMLNTLLVVARPPKLTKIESHNKRSIAAIRAHAVRRGKAYAEGYGRR